MPKMTLYVKKSAVVARAKKYAAAHDTSVSDLVEQFLDALGRRAQPMNKNDAPILRQLQHSLQGTRVNESDYARYLEKKYG
jgi:hypothetical protein